MKNLKKEFKNSTKTNIKKNILLLSLLVCWSGIQASFATIFIDSEIVSLEDTLERFYIIQRVDPLMFLIESTPEHFWIFPSSTLYKDSIYYDGVSFHNPHIIALINAIETERSIKPILHAWGQLKRYKYLHNIYLIKEFMQLLFVVTRYSFKNQLPMTFEESATIKNVYGLEAVDMLSLEQILDVLDIIIEDMPGFIEKYELHSDLTWKEWLHKYWPVAPIAVAAFSLKVYLDYQSQQKKIPVILPQASLPAVAQDAK